jgi:hypothetical protein
VVDTSIVEFAGQRTITIVRRALPGHGGRVAEKARTYLGQHYSLLTFNCEHLANEVTTGVHYSTQVRTAGWVTLAATTLVAVFASAANTNGTRVDHSGYRRNANGQFANRRWW